MNEKPAEQRIRLVLLEAQALFRASLAGLLSRQPDLDVVGECSSPDEVLEILRARRVDVALLDFDCGGEGCGRFVPAARRNGYHGRFLIVAETGEARRAAAAIRSGASGIFLKSESPGRLVEAIRIVAAGGIWLDPEIVRELAEHSVRGGPEADSRSSACVLTDRERKVLLGILGGLTNRKIGAHLGLSESCIKTSIREMFHKTGARRRSQLVRAAIEGPLKPLAGTPSRF